MRVILAAILALSLPAQAGASCVCRCIDGEMQPACTSAMDLRPVCPAIVCMKPLPLVAPIRPLSLPPLGMKQCAQRQVLNPDTDRYEWQRVCH